jgi:hypothetical protein
MLTCRLLIGREKRAWSSWSLLCGEHAKKWTEHAELAVSDWQGKESLVQLVTLVLRARDEMD